MLARHRDPDQTLQILALFYTDRLKCSIIPLKHRVWHFIYNISSETVEQNDQHYFQRDQEKKIMECLLILQC